MRHLMIGVILLLVSSCTNNAIVKLQRTDGQVVYCPNYPKNYEAIKREHKLDVKIPNIEKALSASASSEQTLQRIRAEIPDLDVLDAIHAKLCYDYANDLISKEIYVDTFVNKILPDFRNNLPRKEKESFIPGKIFRSTPIDNLSEDAVRNIVIKYNFFVKSINKGDISNDNGVEFKNKFELRYDGLVVVDYASGLMWQRESSDNYYKIEDARKYINKLNESRFAQYDDWRLPTIEETMTLIRKERKKFVLHIDRIFSGTMQFCMWTSDQLKPHHHWYVAFNIPGCGHLDDFEGCWVRAVR